MNQSYLNGPFHEWSKRIHPYKELGKKLFSGDQKPSLLEGIQLLGGVNWVQIILGGIHHFWSIPDGPVFMVKVSMLMLDRFFERGYSFNQNPICRSPNHSSVLSKKQNLGWFL